MVDPAGRRPVTASRLGDVGLRATTRQTHPTVPGHGAEQHHRRQQHIHHGDDEHVLHRHVETGSPLHEGGEITYQHPPVQAAEVALPASVALHATANAPTSTMMPGMVPSCPKASSQDTRREGKQQHRPEWQGARNQPAVERLGGNRLAQIRAPATPWHQRRSGGTTRDCPGWRRENAAIAATNTPVSGPCQVHQRDIGTPQHRPAGPHICPRRVSVRTGCRLVAKPAHDSPVRQLMAKDHPDDEYRREETQERDAQDRGSPRLVADA